MHIPRIPLSGEAATLGAGAATLPAASQSFAITDVRLLEYLQLPGPTATGIHVNVDRALRNTSMFRAVALISGAIGMLPLQLIEREAKVKAQDHPLYRVLHRRPNGWQTAYDFRSLMQLRALVKGDAYALIGRSLDVRSGARKVVALIPLDPDRMTVVQSDDWAVSYRYQPLRGGRVIFEAEDIFHLRGLSFNGLTGVSLVRQAAEAIGLALAAELAAGRMFKNGTFVGGAISHPGKLSGEALQRLRESLAQKEGAENAGKNFILEEGMKFEAYGNTARNAQMTELLKLQVEEIARVTGVPRPLLMVDETSWGSGIEALGRFFVQYALGPWFEAWQQAVERSLLSDADVDRYEAKFNPGALLRGSMADQAEFFAKALGAGGAPGWMSQNEVRDIADMPRIEGGDVISKGAMAQVEAPPS